MKKIKAEPLCTTSRIMRFLPGSKVRTIRLCLGMEQKEFAEKFDIDQATLARIELGQRKLQVPVAQKIGEITGVSWAWFFEN